MNESDKNPGKRTSSHDHTQSSDPQEQTMARRAKIRNKRIHYKVPVNGTLYKHNTVRKSETDCAKYRRLGFCI